MSAASRMTVQDSAPRAAGQLVWCPLDPALGIGVITDIGHSRVRVRFVRLQEERFYTTRELVLARYEIQPGERVLSSDGREVRVLKRVKNKKSDDLLVRYALEDGREVPESDLVPDIRDVGAKERLASLNLVHPEVVRARIAGLELEALGSRPGTAAILGARAQWLPHQIDVATRAIEMDPVRMLLADEVGLGKTVEAALIYAGLRHEGRANRILILTPESLCIQWLGEIYRKTHELLVLLDDDRIEDAEADFPDLPPFDAHQRIVASIEMVAGDELLAAQAAESEWDLVVVDEAHHLRWRQGDTGNPAYRLVEKLAHQSRHLLLLTATPMALDPAEYHALLRLLDPERFDAPQAFEQVTEHVTKIRNAARAVQASVAAKKALPKKVQDQVRKLLSDDDEDLQNLAAFLQIKPGASQRIDASEEILAMLRERHGLADYVVRNRRGPVGGLPDRQPQTFALEPSEVQQEVLELGEGVMFELAKTFESPRESHRTLGRLLRALWATPRALLDILKPLSPSLASQLAPHIAKVVSAPLDADGLPTGDVRLRWLVQLLRKKAKEKILVFVETSIAVRALKDALESVVGGDIAVFHRGLSPRDQDRQVAWFRDPEGPSIMLSTEAGGEGRNFQFCHVVVLYDLPWRPATIEQRIGRVDRVGQTRDVQVLVPYFRSGYEAAILKVMQEAIGVLDRTVGGIDYALEYVSDRIAALILDTAPADAWKALYLETSTLIKETQARIESSVDPILDFASFSPERAQAVLKAIPEDLEARAEAFVRGYAAHTKLEMHPKGAHLLAVEGAPSAAGGAGMEAAYVATFSRAHALDHEAVEFMSFGHPLVEQAMEWAAETVEASAALALCRGFDKDGAVFLWRFELELPDDVPEAAAYVAARSFTYAVDESGKRQPRFEKLLDDGPPLDRMDAAPLKNALGRWRSLVESTYEHASEWAGQDLEHVVAEGRKNLNAAMARRERSIRRQIRRRLQSLGPKSRARKKVEAEEKEALRLLAQEKERLSAAMGQTHPHLISAVAVRLVRSKSVSA